MGRTSLAIVLAVAIGWPTPAHADEVLKNASTMMGRADGVRRSPPTSIDDKYLELLRGSVAACNQAFDEAIAAGAKPEDDVIVPDKTVAAARREQNANGSWVRVAPLKDAHAYCKSLTSEPDLLRVKKALRELDGWWAKGPKEKARAESKEGFDKDARITAEVLLNKAPACHEVVNAALASGVAPDTELKLKNAGTITLGAAGEQICEALARSANEIMKVEEDKLEAMIAPYRAVLKGDRISTFVDRQMLFDTIYGAGGDILKTPEQLQAAKAWFLVLTGDIGLGLSKVTVRRYRWAGDKLKDVTEKTGCCK